MPSISTSGHPLPGTQNMHLPSVNATAKPSLMTPLYDLPKLPSTPPCKHYLPPCNPKPRLGWEQLLWTCSQRSLELEEMLLVCHLLEMGQAWQVHHVFHQSTPDLQIHLTQGSGYSKMMCLALPPPGTYEIGHTLPDACFSEEQCRKIQLSCLSTFLSKMGINKNSVTKMQSGPMQFPKWDITGLWWAATKCSLAT